MTLILSCSTNKSITTVDEKHGKLNIQYTLNRLFSSTLKGHVTDLESNEPLIDIKIILINSDGKTFGVITDQEGNFNLNNIPLGNYKIEIRGFGYEQIESQIKIESHTDFMLDVKLNRYIIQVEKPIIYLYPTQKQKISVKLNFKGTLTHTYPKSKENGWTLTGEPNGTLWDENGTEYYALFWEGEPAQNIIPTSGFVVKGEETAKFLEEKLSFLGLNRKEANEFILYWLPRMENNPYNFIHFAGSEYEEQAELRVFPQPETSIRVMMLTQPLKSHLNFPIQDLTSHKRKRNGFTLVEWGGTTIHFINENF